MQKMKRGFALLLALALVFSLLSVSAGAAELADYEPAGSMTELYAAVVTGGGAAPETGVYSIASAGELQLLAEYVNAGNDGAGLTFYLTDDVDLGGEPWTPIGQYAAAEGAVDRRFAGTFDGCGHAVTGLYVGGDDYTKGNGATNEANGLFGINAGVIQNLAVEGEIHTYRCGAIIAGHNEGTVSACLVSGSISANGGGGVRGSGGVAGENSGTVESCISRVTVYNAYRRAGGIVGYNYLGTVRDSFFTGSASSASEGYSGGVAATNENAAIENCYWLEGSSADNCAYYQTDTKEYVTTGVFTAEGLVTESGEDLLSALNSDSFKASAAGGLPILFWDDSDVQTYTVTVTQPAAGGTVSVSYGDPARTIEGSASVQAGTSLTLSASAAEEGWFFRGFSVGGTITKGAAAEEGFTAGYTVSGDVEISAVYSSMDDTALTIATQEGETGAVTPVKTYSWNELFALAGTEQEPAGYMYTHGSDGWNVVGATRYVPVAELIAGAGLEPAAEDEIIALEGEGHSAIIPTWELLQSELYFFPNGADDGSTPTWPTEGKVPVPAAMALCYSTGRVGATAADKLALAAENAAFTGSLRFVFGSAESDYVELKNTQGTITGNRLWGNVDTLVIRSASEADGILVSVFGQEHSLSELKAYETEATFTTVKKGETLEVAVKGITMTDLLTQVCGLSEDEFATVTFTAGDGFTATVDAADYAWDDVMLIWDGNGASDTALQSAVNGGAGKLWNKGVVTVTGEAPAFNFNGTPLSLAKLQALGVTNEGWTYSSKGNVNTVDVTGATLASLLAAYEPDADEPESVTFYARNTDGSPDYASPIALADYAADQIMVIWDGAGASETSLRSAANGGTGKQWWSGVVGCELTWPEPAAVNAFGTDYTLSELKVYETEATFTTVKKGETLEVAVKGITMTDLLTQVCGLSEDEFATVTFTAGDGFTSTVDAADYGWDDVMLIWDGNGASDTALQSAVNGGAGKLWNKGVVTVTGEAPAFNFNGTPLSLAKLQALGVTNEGWTYSSKGNVNTVDVTGATLASLLAAYAPEAAPASVTFYARNTDGSPDYGPEIALAGLATDQIMVIWDGANASETSLRSAVNGGTGKQWWSGVVGCELSDADVTIDGVPFTKGMLAALQDLDGAAWTKGANETAVTGVSLAAITAAYPELDGETVCGVSFISSDGFTSPVYAVDEENGLEKAAIIWVEGENEVFKSAVNGAAGRYWVNGLAEVTFLRPVTFTFVTTPEDAEVEVTDANENAVEPNEDGSFTLVSGQTYTYTVSASGYTAQSDSFTPAKDLLSLTVELNPRGGGSGGGGGTGPVRPSEEAIFTLYLQEGEDGEPVLAKTFTRSEVNGVLQSGVFSYLFYKNGGWAAIVATKVLTLEDIILEADATAQWKRGSYLKFTCKDGEYGKAYPSYDDIQAAGYTFDADGNASVVPAGIAIVWDSAVVGSSGAKEELTAANFNAIAATAKDTGSYRLVYGTTEELFESANAGGDAPAGARSPTGVIAMTIVYDASSVPSGSVGTTHKNEGGAGGSGSEDGKEENAEDGAEESGSVGEPLVFDDVKEGDWYKEAVDYVTARGLFKGVSEDLFAPAADMSRAMFATVLYRMAGEPAVEGENPFTDVESGTWYTDAVIWAAEQGYVLGYGDGRFGPNDPVTREQMVTIFWRRAGSPAPTAEEDLGRYSDAALVHDWARDAFRWAVETGVIQGKTQMDLAPRDTATRAEVAQIVKNMASVKEA